jgi:hypothetical protein
VAIVIAEGGIKQSQRQLTVTQPIRVSRRRGVAVKARSFLRVLAFLLAGAFLFMIGALTAILVLVNDNWAGLPG